MPALHNRLFDIDSHNTVNKGFDTLQGVKLDIILEMINTCNLLIDYCEGGLCLEWHVEGGQQYAYFIECENY